MRKHSQHALIAIMALSLGIVAEAQTPSPPNIGQSGTPGVEQVAPVRNVLPYQVRLAGSAIPLTDAKLLLYRTIVDGEKSGSLVLLQDIQSALQLDATVSSALFSHMKATIAEIDRFRKEEFSSAVCARSKDIVTARQLTDALLGIDLRTDKHRELAVSGAESVLGRESRARLDEYVSSFRRGLTWSKTSQELYVEFNVGRGMTVD